MKKLLIVVNDARFFLTHRLPIALAARKKGFEVHVATTRDSYSDTIAGHGLVFHEIPFARSGMQPVHELHTILKIYRLYRQLRPDIVHHVTIKPVLYGGLVARILSVPAVVSAISGLGYLFVARGILPKVLRLFVTVLYRLALNHKNCCTIVQNPDDRNWLVRSGIVGSDSIRKVPGSGVDLDIFSPMPEKKGSPIVLFASRLLWDKGIGEYVQAAYKIASEGVKAKFVIAGERDPGNPSTVPERILEKWKKDEVVSLIGYQENMPAVRSSAHIFCLPSYREGLSKALIEAAASGRPVITTDVPGCRDVVEDGVNGLLVPTRDIEALAVAMKKLIENSAIRESMGRAGRIRAEREFGIKGIVSKTLDIYDELLNLEF